MKYAFYKIITISSSERKLFFEALFVSLCVRIMLIMFPFKQYSHKLGEKGKVYKKENGIDLKLIANISLAIKRAVKYSLWRNKCLEQAITAKKMLKKRNVKTTIYFGVRKTENKLEAHAWLKTGDDFVVGEKNYETFTIVAFYT